MEERSAEYYEGRRAYDKARFHLPERRAQMARAKNTYQRRPEIKLVRAEFDANRFAPCTPVRATSPTA